MKRTFFGLSILGLLTGLVGLACSDSSTNTNTNPDAGPTPTVDGGQTDSAVTGKLPFTPSNISIEGVDISTVGDWTVDSATCTLHTETKEVGCGDSDALVYTTITQPDASKVGVYIARSIRVEPNAKLTFKGTYGVAIVALDTFEVLGGIDIGADTSYASAGGFKGPSENDKKGAGPGGGGAGSTTNGAGGGSFCGIGGKGAAIEAGTAANGGTAYGNPEISPLVGGSAGGTGTLGGNSGTGGGALQLVAGKSFRITASGSVASGGGGGSFWGAPASQHSGAGGSGGAVLIESQAVTVEGIIAANGGGGGGKEIGKNGDNSETPAPGGSDNAGSKGGDGSAGTDPKGGDAARVAPANGGGGGGGAGRIRINTTSGTATISGKLSPPVASTCASEGTVKPL